MKWFKLLKLDKSGGHNLFNLCRLQLSEFIKPNQTCKCQHRKHSALHQSCYSLVYSSLGKIDGGW